MSQNEYLVEAGLPSLHKIKQKANVAAWISTRQMLLDVCTEINSMPSNQLCSVCASDKALFRCHQCGPNTYYCSNCLDQYHTLTSILHSPEEYKVIYSF